MAAEEVIFQSISWNELKKQLYRIGIGKPLDAGSSEIEAPKDVIFSPSADVIDVVRFSEYGIDLNDCVINVQQQKNIIKTAIQGRNGTVKEYISDGDCQVTLKGRISSNKPDVFPEAGVSNLVDVLQLPEALEIESEYLRFCFGIYMLVVESYSMQRREGMSSEQEYEIKCVSHLPVELTINEL
jgi:hypothetical protein